MSPKFLTKIDGTNYNHSCYQIHRHQNYLGDDLGDALKLSIINHNEINSLHDYSGGDEGIR
ncbi:hypothetical protein, partial [Halocynthiibacter sp.]|uniref:hypothetical protein n=1 Tax=Halocynthiibacter sp. TaxID=1979210 RepID=UPI003C60E76A